MLAVERNMVSSVPLHEQLRQCLRRYLSRINTEVVLTRSCQRCGFQAPDLGPDQIPAFLEAVSPTLSLYLNLSESRALLASLREVAGVGPAPVREPRSELAPASRPSAPASRPSAPASRPSAPASRPSAPASRPSAPAPSWSKRATSDFGHRAVAQPAADAREISITVTNDVDVECARTAALGLAKAVGLGQVDAVKLATVVSELARNITMYAGQGTVTLQPLSSPRPGIAIQAEDHGPGIEDVDHVLSGQYRSRTGLGLGLRGSKRLVDRFEVSTSPALGTTITAVKYR